MICYSTMSRMMIMRNTRKNSRTKWFFRSFRWKGKINTRKYRTNIIKWKKLGCRKM